MHIEAYDEHLDCALDEALKGTFPASDPVSVSACHTLPIESADPVSRPPKRRKKKRRAGEGK